MRTHSRVSMCLLSALLTSSFVNVTPVRASDVAEPVPVRVERVKPHKPKLPTLRFLRTNIDFVRGRLDLLREKPLHEEGGARDMDPRFLAYRDLLASVQAAGDSVTAAADAAQRRDLFASIGELAQLELQLDRMGALLADQRVRLQALQEDFSGHQRSALAVVVGGAPAGPEITALSLTRDDGTRLTVELSPEERGSLAAGGTLEVFHGLIEPREQVIEIELQGADWAGAPHGFVTLSPGRDQLTFLRLDVGSATQAQGASAITATTWRHLSALPAGAALQP